MKKILSISLGNSKRDAKVFTSFANEEFEISRIGTNGDVKKMKKLFEEYDGKVDAFGIGGFDLYVYAGKDKKIPFPEPNRIISQLKTPVCDGSILKITLEPMVIENLHKDNIIDLTQLKAFCTIGVDRFGMAEILFKYCKEVVCGDLIFSLGIPFPIKKLSTLIKLSKILAPIIVKLPFDWLYPTGEKAEQRNLKWIKFFEEADIIAGDFHYILKYRSDNMKGKIIITNTITKEDIKLLENIGVKVLITTTPQIQDRTFGTNVIEAMLYTLINKSSPTPLDFENKIKELKLDKGHIKYF